MPTLPITDKIFKSMEAAFHSMTAYLDEHGKKSEKMSHFNSFMKTLGIQTEIFSRHGRYKQSLLHQINTQFSEEFADTHPKPIVSYSGIVFIDFDDTILNQTLYAKKYERYQLANQKIQEKHLNIKPYTIDLKFDNEFYNGVQLQGWRKIFQSLKAQNFMIVLCTSRIPILGEDDVFEQMIREDLKDYFDKTLLIGNIGYKGFVMRYIHNLITTTYQTYFDPQSFYLVDDDAGHIESATRCGFSVIQSYSCVPRKFLCGYPQQWNTKASSSCLDSMRMPSAFLTLRRDPVPDFIEKLYALPNTPDLPTVQSAQLPPLPPIPQTPRRANTVFTVSDPDFPEPRPMIPQLSYVAPQINRADLPIP